MLASDLCLLQGSSTFILLSTLDLTSGRFHQGPVSNRLSKSAPKVLGQKVHGSMVAFWSRLETPSRPLVNPSLPLAEPCGSLVIPVSRWKNQIRLRHRVFVVNQLFDKSQRFLNFEKFRNFLIMANSSDLVFR